MDPQGIRDTESRSGHSTGSFCIPPEDHHHREKNVEPCKNGPEIFKGTIFHNFLGYQFPGFPTDEILTLLNARQYIVSFFQNHRGTYKSDYLREQPH